MQAAIWWRPYRCRQMSWRPSLGSLPSTTSNGRSTSAGGSPPSQRSPSAGTDGRTVNDRTRKFCLALGTIEAQLRPPAHDGGGDGYGAPLDIGRVGRQHGSGDLTASKRGCDD